MKISQWINRSFIRNFGHFGVVPMSRQRHRGALIFCLLMTRPPRHYDKRFSKLFCFCSMKTRSVNVAYLHVTFCYPGNNHASVTWISTAGYLYCYCCFMRWISHYYRMEWVLRKNRWAGDVIQQSTNVFHHAFKQFMSQIDWKIKLKTNKKIIGGMRKPESNFLLE